MANEAEIAGFAGNDVHVESLDELVDAGVVVCRGCGVKGGQGCQRGTCEKGMSHRKKNKLVAP
jgi:hypothetical protein